MAQVGLMIEGQEGLTWERWDRILRAADDFGYQCVFRSDHFTNPNPPDLESLEAWVSLTYAATATQRIEFGTLVSPITFRHPSILVRMAAAIDDLSRGRLVLGMGAGWQEREHHLFGVPFYDFPKRYDMLRDGLEVVTRLLHSDDPVSFKSEYFPLERATLLPRPKRPGGPPILIGGIGKKRTLPLAAEYADEWNGVFVSAEKYRELNAYLNDLLAERGRVPGEVKRSLMTRVLIAKDDAALDDLLRSKGKTLDEVRASGRAIVGTPSMVIDQMGAFIDAGVERFMLQWLELDDIDRIEMMAREVLPHFHK